MPGGVVGGQGAPQGDGLLGGVQRLLVAADLIEPVAEIVQRRGEASLVFGGISAARARNRVTASWAASSASW